MLAITIHDTKEFMALLLKGKTFDDLRLRQLDVTTFTFFQISGQRNKEFYPAEEQGSCIDRFCLWSEIKPFALQVIKGNKLPKAIKIIFSLGEKETASFSEKASALFLNVTFEQNTITCTTGCSQKNFSLDKSLDYDWDQWVLHTLKEKQIGYQIVE